MDLFKVWGHYLGLRSGGEVVDTTHAKLPGELGTEASTYYYCLCLQCPGSLAVFHFDLYPTRLDFYCPRGPPRLL